MNKNKLTFSEWSKLSKEDPIKKYHLLSKHDQFIQRTTSLSDELNITIKECDQEITKEEQDEALEFLKNYAEEYFKKFKKK